MKCRVCREPAVIDVRRQNANYCAEHFLRMCRDQVAKAIDEFAHDRAGRAGARRRVGRQGLARPVGHPARARLRRRRVLHLARHRRLQRRLDGHDARRSPPQRGWPLEVSTCARSTASTCPPRPTSTRRVPCSACGLSKRHLFDDAARRGGYDVVATGHNLDDEAAVLFGNVLRWDDRVPRPPAARAARAGRLPPQGEAARAPGRARDGGVLRAARASTTSSRSARWPRATSTSATRRRSTRSRRESPGTKHAFYFGFLAGGVDALRRDTAQDDGRPRGLRALRRADDRRRLRVLPLVERAAGAEPVAFTGRSAASAVDEPPAAARGRRCCCSTRSAGATSSRWPRAASSTPTPASCPTTS